MIKEVVKMKIGIKPEPSSVSENAAEAENDTEGTEDTSESKRVVTEAGNLVLCLSIFPYQLYL